MSTDILAERYILGRTHYPPFQLFQLIATEKLLPYITISGKEQYNNFSLCCFCSCVYTCMDACVVCVCVRVRLYTLQVLRYLTLTPYVAFWSQNRSRACYNLHFVCTSITVSFFPPPRSAAILIR
jgi:hypothetical protein